MTLLAYSLRRALGALLVFLLVVWLSMLAVAHMAVNVRHPGRDVDLSAWKQWRTQPETWTAAMLELAGAVGVVCVLVILWKLRPKVPFSVLVATGGVLLAFGLASIGVALANQDYRRLGGSVHCERACIPPAIHENLERRYNRGIDPTPWWIAGSISTALGVTVVGAAVTTRRSRSTPQG